MRLSKLTSALVLATATPTAMASGFALIEQSASSQGASYAGAAVAIDDASVMWFNPAGLTAIEGNQAIVGGHFILPSAKFTNDGSYLFGNPSLLNIGGDANGATTGFIPNIYWKGHYNGYTVGLGINVPFGQHVSYDETWVGRYNATETDLKTMNINPSVAKKVNDKLSIGFGLNAQYADVVLEQKINQMAFGATTPDGNAKVSGDSWAFGYNFGLTYKASDVMNIGASYRSKITHNVEGKVKYSDIHPVAAASLYDADASASVNLPATASLAMDYQLSETTTLLASTTWTGWSAYDELVVEFDNGSPDSESNQDFKDTMRYSLGVSYKASPKATLRAGWALDNTPVSDATKRSPRTPDNDRRWLSVGIGYEISKTAHLDIAYSNVSATESKVDYTTSTALGDSTLKGSYDSHIDIFSAQMVWKY